MKNTLIVDTGYLLAIANPRDKWHKQAVKVSKSLEGRLLTTWPVITETSHFFVKYLSYQTQILLLQQIRSGILTIHNVNTSDLDRMMLLMEKYADLPMDLADASLLLLAEALEHGNILSTDRRDFNSYRWKNHKPFTNLLIPES